MDKGFEWLGVLSDIAINSYTEDEKKELLAPFDTPESSENSDFIHPKTIQLTKRQRDVLELILNGYKNKQIAEELSLSIYTVNDYVKELLRSHLVSSRRELISTVKNGRLLPDRESELKGSQSEQVYTILNDLSKLDLNICEKRKYFFDHFCKIIGGNHYLWYESEFHPQMPYPRVFNYLTDFSPHQQKIFLAAAMETELVDPYMIPSIVHKVTSGAESYARREIIADESWYAAEYTHKYYKGCGVDNPLCFMKHQADNQYCGILIFNEWQEEDFSIPTRDFMENVFKEITWLFCEKPNPNKKYFDQLNYVEQKVLNLLLEGMGKEEIAELMQVSAHTANDFIKKIYKTFEVNSYPKLMKKFIH